MNLKMWGDTKNAYADEFNSKNLEALKARVAKWREVHDNGGCTSAFAVDDFSDSDEEDHRRRNHHTPYVVLAALRQLATKTCPSREEDYVVCETRRFDCVRNEYYKVYNSLDLVRGIQSFNFSAYSFLVNLRTKSLHRKLELLQKIHRIVDDQLVELGLEGPERPPPIPLEPAPIAHKWTIERLLELVLKSLDHGPNTRVQRRNHFCLTACCVRFFLADPHFVALEHDHHAIAFANYLAKVVLLLPEDRRINFWNQVLAMLDGISFGARRRQRLRQNRA